MRVHHHDDLSGLDTNVRSGYHGIEHNKISGGINVAKQPAHHRQEWTPKDIAVLRRLARENTPTRVIGIKIGRTPDAVRTEAVRRRISLKPTNQSPYG